MRLVFVFLIPSISLALPSFTGLYGGTTRDKITYFGAKLTPRSFLKNISIVALRAACTTQLPNQDPVDSERSTNITKNETPIIRVRDNGRFQAEFNLIFPYRVDFKDATVTIQGRLRGGTGRANITIVHTKTYEDSTTETCAGTANVYLRRP